MPIGALIPATTHLLQTNLANQAPSGQAGYPPAVSKQPPAAASGSLGQNPPAKTDGPLEEFKGQLELLRHKWQVEPHDSLTLQNLKVPTLPPVGSESYKAGANGQKPSGNASPSQEQVTAEPETDKPSSTSPSLGSSAGSPKVLTPDDIRIALLNSPPDNIIKATIERRENG